MITHLEQKAFTGFQNVMETQYLVVFPFNGHTTQYSRYYTASSKPRLLFFIISFNTCQLLNTVHFLKLLVQQLQHICIFVHVNILKIYIFL